MCQSTNNIYLPPVSKTKCLCMQLEKKFRFTGTEICPCIWVQLVAEAFPMKKYMNLNMMESSSRRCSSLAWRSVRVLMRVPIHCLWQITTAATNSLFHELRIQVVDTLNLLFSYFLTSKFTAPGDNALLRLCFLSDFLAFFKTINRISIKLRHTGNYLDRQEDWFFRLHAAFCYAIAGSSYRVVVPQTRTRQEGGLSPRRLCIWFSSQDRNKSYECQHKIQEGICSSGHKLYLPVQSKLLTPPFH